MRGFVLFGFLSDSFFLQWEQHFPHFSSLGASKPFQTTADSWQGKLQHRKITPEWWTQGHTHRNCQAALTTDMTA